jgi:hypothetical protein
VCARERGRSNDFVYILLKVALNLLQNLTVRKAVMLIKFMDPITSLFYVMLIWTPLTQNPIFTSQHPIMKKKEEDVKLLKLIN